MEYPVNLVVTQLFDLNARIQQLTWSLIFYENYSTSLLDLWFLTTANFGGFSNFCRYYTRSQTGKSTGPLWNPCSSLWVWLFVGRNTRMALKTILCTKKYLTKPFFENSNRHMNEGLTIIFEIYEIFCEQFTLR